eukprot:COSAG03_NODE_37_length_17551_cov_15.651444_12_plen_125_part_00
MLPAAAGDSARPSVRFLQVRRQLQGGEARGVAALRVFIGWHPSLSSESEGGEHEEPPSVRNDWWLLKTVDTVRSRCKFQAAMCCSCAELMLAHRIATPRWVARFVVFPPSHTFFDPIVFAGSLY